MIIRPHLHWFRMLLAWRGSVLPQLLPRLFLIFAISVIAVAAHDHLLPISLNLNTTAPFSLIGIALAVFLGFRNNASYDRWWEARKLWGQLLNDARSLTRQALTLRTSQLPKEEVAEFCAALGALPHALRHQLRRSDPRDDLAARLPPALFERVMASRYKPATLMLVLGEWVQRQAQNGSIDPMGVLAFDRNLNGLSDVIGGCERIVSTPLPFAYSVMIHRTVYFFCASLPFGLVDSIGILRRCSRCSLRTPSWRTKRSRRKSRSRSAPTTTTSRCTPCPSSLKTHCAICAANPRSRCPTRKAKATR